MRPPFNTENSAEPLPDGIPTPSAICGTRSRLTRLALLTFALVAVGAVGGKTFTVRVLPQDPNRLEPSTLNELEHALDLAETYLARHPGETNRTDATSLTNGLTPTAIARKLIALQRADGHWSGTNATFTCYEILRDLEQSQP